MNAAAVGGGPWRDLGVRTVSGAALALVGLGSIWIGGFVWLVCVGLLGAGMAAEWLILCRRRPGLRWVGLAYIMPAILALVWLRGLPDGLRWVAFLAAVVWSGDIGAYLVGRLVGGPRLAPRISPGKTWSGAVGGTLCAVLAGVAASSGDVVAALPALGLSLAAQGGDLLESALKRHFGVKDSSRVIPGHGGLLDRLDGVLTAAPLAALLAVTVRL